MTGDASTVSNALAAIKNGMDTIRSALELFKGATETLPDSARKTAIADSVEQAEREIRLGETQIALALGYHLCRCTFPPQIMVSVGHTSGQHAFQCPDCKKLESVQPHSGRTEPVIRYNAGPPR
ncbi:MAG TPA: hypothetical protein VJS41_06300 [Stellaceae bacterium]|nr:hypothetical protein [Stellaceae bacterium]